MSRWHLLVLDELDVLEDHVLSDLSSQVDELHIVVEPVEGVDPMVVFEVSVDGGLAMVALSGYLGGILPLEDDLADDGGLMRYARAHVVKGTGVRKHAAVLGFVASPELGDPCRLPEQDEAERRASR